jgi:hypothetical protein
MISFSWIRIRIDHLSLGMYIAIYVEIYVKLV